MINRQLQEAKMAEARRLILSGVSRRKMDPILRRKYGEGIGKSTHFKLFGERVQQIAEREAPPVGYKAPRKRAQQLYNRLRQSHFLVVEAKELARELRGARRIHELPIMAAERERLYNRFLRKAAEESYTRAEFRREWIDTVRRWYGANALRWQKKFERWHKERGHRVEKKRDLISLLWRWFGHTKSELPPDYQYETPKKARRKQQDFIKVDKVKTSKWINELNAKIADPSTTPAQKAQYREQVKRLRGSLRREK